MHSPDIHSHSPLHQPAPWPWGHSAQDGAVCPPHRTSVDVKPGKPVLNCVFGLAIFLTFVTLLIDSFGTTPTNGGCSTSCSATTSSDVDTFVCCSSVPMMKNRVLDMRNARMSNNLVLFLMLGCGVKGRVS